MADVLKRLAGPVALTAADVGVYTVGSTVATVRSIHVVNETATPVSFNLSIGADGAGKRFFYQQVVAQGDPFDWSGVLVLASGESLHALASVAASLTLTVSGVETS